MNENQRWSWARYLMRASQLLSRPAELSFSFKKKLSMTFLEMTEISRIPPGLPFPRPPDQPCIAVTYTEG